MDDNACPRPETTVVARVCNSSTVKERLSGLRTLKATFTWQWQPVVALTSLSLYPGQNSSVPSRPIYTQHAGWSTGQGRTLRRKGNFPLLPWIRIHFQLNSLSGNPKCRLCGLAEEAAWMWTRRYQLFGIIGNTVEQKISSKGVVSRLLRPVNDAGHRTLLCERGTKGPYWSKRSRV